MIPIVRGYYHAILLCNKKYWFKYIIGYLKIL